MVAHRVGNKDNSGERAEWAHSAFSSLGELVSQTELRHGHVLFRSAFTDTTPKGLLCLFLSAGPFNGGRLIHAQLGGGCSQIIRARGVPKVEARKEALWFCGRLSSLFVGCI
jgi:hypothetical protein